MANLTAAQQALEDFYERDRRHLRAIRVTIQTAPAVERPCLLRVAREQARKALRARAHVRVSRRMRACAS
jgi:hypothetical protein